MKNTTKTITIYDVAKDAGISPRSVSRYFNAPEKLGKPTREKLAKVIKRLHFRPNVYANRVSNQKKDVVAVMAYYKEDYKLTIHHLTLLSYISYQLSLCKKDLLLIVANHENEESIIKESLMLSKFDILLLLNPPGPLILEELKSMDFPKITINWKPREKMPSHVCIGVDGYKAGMKFARALWKKNYRNILYVGPHYTKKEAAPHGKAVLDLYNGKGKQAHCDFIRYLPDDCGSHADRARKIIRQVLKKNMLPQLIVCYNDYIASILMSVVREAGLKIRIAGYGNSILNDYILPTLTTVKMPWEEMVKTAVDLLIDWNEKYDEQTDFIEFESKIVWGTST